MRKIRELLRLKYELGRSHREIATSLGIANSTVSGYVRRAAAAGLSWPLPNGLDDAALEAALFPALPPSRVPRPEPDWEQVHRELQRHKGVTLRLLWLGVPHGSSERLPVQPVLRAIQGVAGAPRRSHAAGLPGGREGVRGLRGPEVPGRGPEHRGGTRRHGLRRRPRRLELHLRGRDLEPRAAGLDDLPRPDVRVLGRLARTRDPGQREGCGSQGQPLRAGPEPDVPGTGHPLRNHRAAGAAPGAAGQGEGRGGGPARRALDHGAAAQPDVLLARRAPPGDRAAAGRTERAAVPEDRRQPPQLVRGLGPASAQAAPGPALRVCGMAKGTRQHRLPHPGPARLLQCPPRPCPPRGRRSDHGPDRGDLPQAPPRRRACPYPQERRIRDGKPRTCRPPTAPISVGRRHG